MKKKHIWAVLFGISLIMVLALVLSGHRLLKERKRAAGLFSKEHSFFETIRICGQGTGGESLSGEKGDKDSSDDAALPDSCRQEVFLHSVNDGEGWKVYIPSDLADRSCLCFEHFKKLELKVLKADQEGQEDSRDKKDSGGKTSGETGVETAGSAGEDDAPDPVVRSFMNGDWIRWSEFPDGALLHAAAIGWDDRTVEETEIELHYAREIPTLYLQTSSGSMDAINQDKTVEEEGRYVFYTETGSKDASGRCRIHGRGNSSWKADKKQYSLNFASPRSVLGIEESEKFALIANHSDSSYLKNRAVLDIAAACEMPATPQTVYVNVYFNGLYNGLYLLAQRPNAKGGSVKIGDLETDNYNAAVASGEIPREDTVPSSSSSEQAEDKNAGTSGQAGGGAAEAGELFDIIDLMDDAGLEIHASSQESVPDNISGGYLLEMDARYKEEKYWFSTDRHHFVVKYPESVPLREEEYIADYVRKAEKAFYQKDGINPDTGKSWQEYLDLDSWVRMYMLQDFTAQWDVESFSFFVFKNVDDPLLYCGPAWDFDLSMGATGLGSLPNVMRLSMWLRDHREGWLTQLESHAEFSKALDDFSFKVFYPAVERWLEESDSLISSLKSSAAMDCARWNEDNDFEESALKVRNWLDGRMAFLKDYRENPQDFCTVTLRYGFSDMDIYVRKGERMEFVPVREYGEHLYSSFRKKYGEIDGWIGEDGQIMTEDTIIDRDQVFTPFAD